MDAFDELRRAWTDVEARFMASPPMRQLAEGDIGIWHYTAFLRETYFFTRENPQIQAVATAWFKGPDREMIKPFLHHALSLVGQEQKALADIETLGLDVSAIPDELPLPTTAPLIGFPYYAIQYRSPVCYLGHLFFLDFLPTSRSGEICATLARLGVPEAAMTFLTELQKVDFAHIRTMELYASRLLRTPAAVGEVIYSMEVTGRLYANMLEGAFEAAEDGAASPAELRQLESVA
jgi:hypothetical protein